MWRLKKYMKPYWKSATISPLFMIIEVIMDLMQPLLMASIINKGILGHDLAHIQRVGLIMLACAVVGLIAGVCCTVFATIASQSFGADVRHALFRKVQQLSFRNLDELSTGSIVTRLTNDIVQLQMLVQMLLRILIRAPLLAIGSLVMAVAISAKLGTVLYVIVPLMIIVLYVLIRHVFPIFNVVQQRLDRVNSVLQENLTGIRVVKAFVRSKFENKRFQRVNTDYMDTAVTATRYVAINMPLMTLLMNVGIVAVLWFGGQLVWNASLPVGDLAAFITYMTQMMISLSLVGNMLVFVSRAKVSADRVNEVFDTESELTEHDEPTDVTIHKGKVTFENVSFSYDQDEAVLKNISFTAEAGKTIAILGATGSGKSSLVHLIPRLYDVSQGSIRIDDVDIRQMSIQHLRAQIAMVLQEAILFTGTIRDNIRFGRANAAQEEVEAAARAAEAHDFILSFPDGYDTVVGQRGVNLSGGQKQRISIARALLMNPQILILDDSTSAVDLATESRIQGALQEMMQTCTCMIIAQRISSVVDADHIVVMDDGRIVDEGKHHELLKHSKVYQEIYQSQLGKEEITHVR